MVNLKPLTPPRRLSMYASWTDWNLNVPQRQLESSSSKVQTNITLSRPKDRKRDSQNGHNVLIQLDKAVLRPADHTAHKAWGSLAYYEESAGCS